MGERYDSVLDVVSTYFTNHYYGGIFQQAMTLAGRLPIESAYLQSVRVFSNHLGRKEYARQVIEALVKYYLSKVSGVSTTTEFIDQFFGIMPIGRGGMATHMSISRRTERVEEAIVWALRDYSDKLCRDLGLRNIVLTQNIEKCRDVLKPEFSRSLEAGIEAATRQLYGTAQNSTISPKMVEELKANVTSLRSRTDRLSAHLAAAEAEITNLREQLDQSKRSNEKLVQQLRESTKLISRIMAESKRPEETAQPPAPIPAEEAHARSGSGDDTLSSRKKSNASEYETYISDNLSSTEEIEKFQMEELLEGTDLRHHDSSPEITEEDDADLY